VEPHKFVCRLFSAYYFLLIIFSSPLAGIN
jgi:hypothetical protein